MSKLEVYKMLDTSIKDLIKQKQSILKQVLLEIFHPIFEKNPWILTLSWFQELSTVGDIYINDTSEYDEDFDEKINNYELLEDLNFLLTKINRDDLQEVFGYPVKVIITKKELHVE